MFHAPQQTRHDCVTLIREAGCTLCNDMDSWTSVLALMNSVRVATWARGPARLSHWPVPGPMMAPYGLSALCCHGCCSPHSGPFMWEWWERGGLQGGEARQGRQMVFTHDCSVWSPECSHMHWGGVFVCERERSCCMAVAVMEPSIPARTLKACAHASPLCLPV